MELIMIYMKVGDCAKFVTFESLPEKFKTRYVLHFNKRDNLPFKELDEFLYEFFKYERKKSFE